VSLCIVGTLVATAIGPAVGQKLFPTKWDLGSRDMFLLTFGLTLFIMALTLAQGLIALKRYRENAFAWVAGVAAFVITVTVVGNQFLTNESPKDKLFLRNEIALVVGSIVSVILVGIFLLLAMRRTDGQLEDLVEIIEHETLEI